MDASAFSLCICSKVFTPNWSPGSSELLRPLSLSEMGKERPVSESRYFKSANEKIDKWSLSVSTS